VRDKIPHLSKLPGCSVARCKLRLRHAALSSSVIACYQRPHGSLPPVANPDIICLLHFSRNDVEKGQRWRRLCPFSRLARPVSCRTAGVNTPSSGPPGPPASPPSPPKCPQGSSSAIVKTASQTAAVGSLSTWALQLSPGTGISDIVGCMTYMY
jgi:hypothetical protein